jgi:Cdc6-like AAA superfamily ATPase
MPVLDTIQAESSSGMSIQPSSVFTGREDILSQLDSYFSLEGPDKEKQHIFVLYGLGGAGKTQIALKFVDKFYERYDARFIKLFHIELIYVHCL